MFVQAPSDPFVGAAMAHSFAVWQLAPSYPTSHDVHVQLPAVPPTTLPLTQ